MTLPAVSVIVLSYNRPRMLAEALGSIVGAAQVIVADDGSDFDVPAFLAGGDWPNLAGAACALVANPRCPLEERLTTPRMGALFNRAMLLARGPVIAYLCDDDLLAPGWPAAAAAYHAAHPAVPLFRGEWLTFRDGEPATMGCPPARLDQRGLTAGNFCHTRALVEAGGRWDETAVAIADDPFIWGLHVAGLIDQFNVPHIGALAGWRREHAHNAISYAQGFAGQTDGTAWSYKPGAERLFAGRWLE